MDYDIVQWKIFKHKDISIDQMIQEVKMLSWNWLKYKSNSMDYDIVQWYWSPRACLDCVDECLALC